MVEDHVLRLLIAGGGTGGHIFIGISLAEEWKRRTSGDVLFVGARGRLEERLVPQAGIALELLELSQLKGVSMTTRLKNVFQLPASLFRCVRINQRFKPDVAIGVGGYSSGPAIVAASLQRVPTMIVEPNAKPGITNRWLSRFIRVAAVAFPDSHQYFGRKMRLTGIPVRKEFFQAATPNAIELETKAAGGGDHVPRLLIFGGSQGSRAINTVAAEAIPLLKEAFPALQVIHQTGEGEYAKYRQHASDWWRVEPFIERMSQMMSSATVVVCRAGASTLAELSASGKCAILVPFPFASDDHQTINARSLEARGAARMLPQSDLSARSLFEAVADLLRDPERRRSMESAIREFANPRSAEMIIELALGLVDKEFTTKAQSAQT
ncbi:MAG TPA: undecaprenyldiphospho-muramoylpentapeptide beta-N-acetylglucosaminyltransferase [Acidobacteriota bacterium]|jgi:UDP-N-acetylglucosamine--N-acetylmuramyl-(pentapeptide) pyrophosphoryl-undecaprenol N-acetylglucosamine transferase